MSRKLERVLVGLVCLSVFAAPFVTGAALANLCGESTNYWRTVRAPSFKSGSQTLADYAVDAVSPNRILVTNGTAVMRSTDSGCSWQQVYLLGAQPAADSTATADNAVIRSIDISEPKRDRVMLMIEEQTLTGTRPHVVRSDDMGASWLSGDTGLPPQGAPEALVLPTSDPNLAYLAIDVGGGSIDLFFASTDGGATWTVRSGPGQITAAMAINGFVVDPVEASSVWAYGTGGLYHSTDGASSFSAVPDFVGRAVSTVDVFHASGQARIAGFIPLESQALVSTNGGKTWLSIAIPASVDSSAHGDSAEKGYVTAQGEVYSFLNATQAWINIGAPQPGAVDVSTDRAGVIYARTQSALMSFDGPDRPRPGFEDEEGVFQPGLIDPPREYLEHDPALTPGNKRVVLDPGGSQTVSYDLRLSKSPLPVNVFFLLDTSDSMGTTIQDLSESVIDIINLLNKEDFNLKVGIGAFRAFPDHLPPRPPCGQESVPGQACETNYVFKRILDIQPASQAVADALETLESDAGGFYKSHFQALYTLATGERVDLFPPGEDSGDVPEGQGATFDRNAYRVVINATDEAFWKGQPRDGGGTDFGNPTPPKTPLLDEVVEALNAKEIYQVGLSIGPAARKDLQDVAKATDAIAPIGGVDCGKKHFIPEGDPLVCPVARNNLTESHNLVPAIVNLIENLPTGVDVKFEAKGNPRVVKKVTPEVQEDVVLQVANDMGFNVTYHCPLDLAGKKFEVDLGARNIQKAELLDGAITEVVCRETPKIPPVIPPIITVSIAALAIPPPPPPPPAQLTSASQAQSQAQAQTGAVFEEEKQPQLAIAAAYREAAQVENDYEYEMVAYEPRSRGVSPYLTLGAGAVMTSMAYAAMMINRSRQRLAPEHQRRRRLR